MSNQNTIMQQQFGAITSIVVNLTRLIAVVGTHVSSVAEGLLEVTPNKPGVIFLLSEIEQTQSVLLRLKADAETAERGLRPPDLNQ